MARIIIFSLVFSQAIRSDAIRCFDCQSVPFPYDCARVTECNTGELCFTEQVVTTSGHVVYNSGCLQKDRCEAVGPALLGKRSRVPSKRVTDLSVCIECCTDSFCNMKGCGVPEIPREQRGPYCFNCDPVIDPKSCEKVAVCLQSEFCMLYSPSEFRGLPGTLYKSHCGRVTNCEELMKTANNSNCPFTCCSGDFCNDRCDSSQMNSMKTEAPTQGIRTSTHVPYMTNSRMTDVIQTTTFFPASADSLTTGQSHSTTEGITRPSSSETPSTTKAPFRCNHHGGYERIHHSQSQLCVHITIGHLNWDEARSACKQEEGDLVVLDTREKVELMKSTLRNNKDYNSHLSYWIGARDHSHHNNFHWTNHAPVDKSETDWGDFEPDIHNQQDCVAMIRKDSYKWHDKPCNETRSFICERI